MWSLGVYRIINENTQQGLKSLVVRKLMGQTWCQKVSKGCQIHISLKGRRENVICHTRLDRERQIHVLAHVLCLLLHWLAGVGNHTQCHFTHCFNIY